MANGYNDNGLVHHTNEGVEFHEDPANGNNKALIQRPSALSNDVYLTLPTTSGQLSTETYVANATGGTFVGLSADFTNTDATSTPENVTGMSFAVEANRVYYIDGAILWFDNAGYGSGKVTLTVPSGTWDFIEQSLTSSGTIGNDAWMDNYDNGGVGNMNQTIHSGNTYNTFKGILVTSSTVGTVQLQFINTAGDGTEQGIRKGSFIRIIDPQG